MLRISKRPTQSGGFSLEVGDRIVFKKNGEDVILLKTNVGHLMQWGIALVVIGASMIAAFTSKTKTNASWEVLSIVSLPGLLFIAVGGVYLYRAYRKRAWQIDLANQRFILGHQSTLAFEHVRMLFLTSLPTASVRGGLSYQLNLVSTRNSQFTLLSSDDHNAVFEAAQYIAKMTDIAFDGKVREA